MLVGLAGIPSCRLYATLFKGKDMNKVYCCECNKEVDAVLVSGMSIYTHRPELWDKKFYQCPICLNHCRAGKFPDGYRPLADIASPELRAERQRLHDLFDHLWKINNDPKRSRAGWYKYMACGLYGSAKKKFHFGNLHSFQECKRAEKMIRKIYKRLGLTFRKSLI